MYEAEEARRAPPDAVSMTSRNTAAAVGVFSDVGETQFIDMEPIYYRVPATVRAGTGTIGHKVAATSGTNQSDTFGLDTAGLEDL